MFKQLVLKKHLEPVLDNLALEGEEEYQCTDGNTVFRCDSDKNSLVDIYMF